jgi:hypothetical protein
MIDQKAFVEELFKEDKECLEQLEKSIIERLNDHQLVPWTIIFYNNDVIKL